MGFVNNQFDFIDNRFITRFIKTLDVICAVEGQAVSPPLAVPGVGAPVVDVITGTLAAGVTAVVTGIVPTIAVIPGKVLDTFAITFVLVNAAGTTILGPFTVTAVDETKCPGAGTGPGETNVQKHDIQAHIGIAVTETAAGVFTLTFTGVVHFCLVVSKETILKITGAEPFCKTLDP